MTESEIFMEELLADAEAKEEQQSEAYYDLLLLQIQQMQDQITYNFAEAEKEVQIIKQWALNKNHGLQVKIDWMEKKLEAFIRERNDKTIELAHGTLKFHKKPDKVEITDLDAFLKSARPEMLIVVPETLKPDLTKIKAYLKSHINPPPGVVIVAGIEEFTYKLRKEESYGRSKEEIGIESERALYNPVIV